MLIYNVFIKRFKKKINKIFFIENKGYTFKNIIKLINKTEYFINSTNNYVCFISENSIYHIIFYLLCSKLNKTYVPLDPNSNDDDNIKIIKSFKTTNIFASDSYSKILKKNKIKHLSINDLKNKDKIKIKLNKKIQKNNNNKFFLLSFTSGSTGNPKPIAFNQKIKIERAKSNISLYSLNNIGNYLISTPLYHTLAIRLLNIFLIVGKEIYILKKYELSDLLRLIRRKKIGFTFFISDQINQILINEKNFNFLNSLNCLVSSSATLSIKNKLKLINNFKKNIFECYGLSEGAILTNLSIKRKSKYLNSVGKVIPGVKIKIKKKNNSKIGEIYFKSPQRCLGYVKNKNKIQLNVDKNNYSGTGDLGYIKDKYLYLVGRKKNMFKIKGKSIFPEDIENNLIKNNIVKECVISQVKNSNLEDQICLVYTLNSKFNTEEKVKLKCIEVLSSYHFPRYFIKITEFPKNKLGKIKRNSLNKFLESIK